MPFKYLFILALCGTTAGLAAAEVPAGPEVRYRVLEWSQLIPEGWEPPLVPRAYDEVGDAPMDEDSVVQALDRQLVALPGFMRPVVFQGNQVSEFLLVPFLPHHTKSHTHLEPNQMVYVSALEPVRVDNPFAPVWVVGTLSLERAMTDEGPAAYRIADAVTTNYEY